MKKLVKFTLVMVLMTVLFFGGVAISYARHLIDLTRGEEIALSDLDLNIGRPPSGFDYPEDELDRHYSDDKDKEPVKVEKPDTSKETLYYYEGVENVTNIALFGVDAPDGQGGRSDAIMILTINKDTKKIKLATIVRDAYVNIPGKKMDKITHAYAYGGPALAVKTLNSNFNLNIRDYAVVNFSTLPKVIDLIGGVKIKLTQKESERVPGITGPGTYTLTGVQALEFMRLRKFDSDFERGRRQRDVMDSAFKSLLAKPISSYPGILEEILPNIKTNLKYSEVLSIATGVAKNGVSGIDKRRFPEEGYAKGEIINGTYFYVFDQNVAIKDIGNFLYK